MERCAERSEGLVEVVVGVADRHEVKLDLKRRRIIEIEEQPL